MALSDKENSALPKKIDVLNAEDSHANAVNKIKKERIKPIIVADYVKEIRLGNISYLSQAITLVESTNIEKHQKAMQILEACVGDANQAIRIGITGVPGVGKSTFIESFGKLLTSIGKKVAVLAIDPSSSVNNGSILGDKTRMELLVKDHLAYIRPTPSGNTLGGVARSTRESILLCEAAGFDVIIIETVGVGQSETSVHNMVDFFLLLKLAGAGDELQGIKRGIIEMADAIVINKADGDNMRHANAAKTEFNRALHLFPAKESQWNPKVLTCSALQQTGIEEIWELIKSYLNLTNANGYFESHRKKQNKYWLEATIRQELLKNFEALPNMEAAFKTQLKAVNNHKTTPFLAAQKLLEQLYKK